MAWLKLSASAAMADDSISRFKQQAINRFLTGLDIGMIELEAELCN
jgi:hypothetical protein